MKSCLPRFNSQRMVIDYARDFYCKASTQYRRLVENDANPARELAAWKTRIHQNWGHVSLQFSQARLQKIQQGEALSLKVPAKLDGLNADDVVIECLIGFMDEDNNFTVREQYLFGHSGKEAELDIFELALKPHHAGLNHYKIRMYPTHELLSHPFEMGYMIWV